MNTPELYFPLILHQLRSQGILQTNVEVMVPLGAKHGDICLAGGFTTTILQRRACNHDPQHIPYGIAFRKQRQHATEQLTTTPQTQSPTAPDTTAWREQPQHATEQLTTTPQTQIPTAPDTTTESRATGATAAAVPQLPVQKASASASPATEQPDEPEVPDVHGPGQIYTDMARRYISKKRARASEKKNQESRQGRFH